MQRLRLLPIALLATLVAACGGGGGNSVAPSPAPPPAPPPILPSATPAWHTPSCSSVTGAPITFTSDSGLSRAPIQNPASNYFTHGLAALGAGSTLAAIVGTTSGQDDARLYFSTDAGCSWAPSGHTFTNGDAAQFELIEAGGHAFAWSEGNDTLYAIERSGLATPLHLPDSRWFESGPSGIGVDPSNPARLRIAIWECERPSCGHGAAIFETLDRGATWARAGTDAPYGALGLRFSPTNLDHVVAPSLTPAGHVSFDGGNLWLLAQGVPADWQLQQAAIGYDGHTVWLIAAPPIFPKPPNVSVLFVSYDGGLNYQEAFAASDENPFVFLNPIGDIHRHARIFPHPANGDVVYLTYTSRADGTSYLYRYDASLDQLTKRQWPSAEGGVWTIAFNPADANLIYLGLGAVE